MGKLYPPGTTSLKLENLFQQNKILFYWIIRVRSGKLDCAHCPVHPYKEIQYHYDRLCFCRKRKHKRRERLRIKEIFALWLLKVSDEAIFHLIWNFEFRGAHRESKCRGRGIYFIEEYSSLIPRRILLVSDAPSPLLTFNVFVITFTHLCTIFAILWQLFRRLVTIFYHSMTTVTLRFLGG